MAYVSPSVGLLAAQIVGGSQPMHAAAESLARQVHALASTHNVTGEYLNNIGTERDGNDWLVYVDHEAAAAIEFGHVARDHATFVDGLHILGRVAG